jgi:hypothetical protein
MSRAREIGVGLTQLLNAFCGGYASECFSSRCWRLREYRPFNVVYRVVNVIFFWQPNHCKASYDAQVARWNVPADYQGAKGTLS